MTGEKLVNTEAVKEAAGSWWNKAFGWLDTLDAGHRANSILLIILIVVTVLF